jgi:hypothetical protein
MTIKLSQKGFEHARNLIESGEIAIDERDDWSEHQPTAADENRFIEEHGYDEYGKWHLGVDDTHGVETKSRYSFPYGDFERVHRCALLAAESRAGQYGYLDIQLAVAHLHGMVEMAGASARAASRS